MKKRILSFLLILAMLFSNIPLSVNGAEPEREQKEDGTKDYPFLISSTDEFMEFLSLADTEEVPEKTVRYYKLTTDIVSEQTLEPKYHAKNVVLDGDNHVIRGFTVTGAIFQSLANSQIKNIVFDSITVNTTKEKTDNRMAVVAGVTRTTTQDTVKTMVENCRFSNCKISVPYNGTDVKVGIVAGENEATIMNCVVENTCDIVTETVTDVSPVNCYLGGIAAVNLQTGFIVNCLAKGTMHLASAGFYHIVGGISANNQSVIAYCFTDLVQPSYTKKFAYSAPEEEGKYADTRYMLHRYNKSYSMINGVHGKSYLGMSVYEIAAEMSELVMKNYNEDAYEMKDTDYCLLWSVENEDLDLSVDGRTAQVYFYVDETLDGAELTFTDKKTQTIITGKKYAVKVGKYQSGEYIRNQFRVDYICPEQYKMVNQFVLKPNQSYVKSLQNTMDGVAGTYSNVYVNSLPILYSNMGQGEIYPYSMTLSLTNIQHKDEIVDYRFVGEGTPEAPFQIRDEYQLNCLAHHVNHEITYDDGKRYNEACYILTDNIYMQDAFEAIGTYSKDGSKAFRGTFDGQSHSITNLNITKSNSYQGLFGITEGISTEEGYRYAEIKNLNIVSASIADADASNYGDLKGIIVGQAEGTKINGCFTSGSLSGGTQLGGIAGYAYRSFIYNCGSLVTVTSNHTHAWAGGLIGYAEHSEIKNNYYTGMLYPKNIVKLDYMGIGGIAGYEKGSRFAHNYYATASETNAMIYGNGVFSCDEAMISSQEYLDELQLYAEQHGLGTNWGKNQNISNGYYPVNVSEQDALFYVKCIPTSAGTITADVTHAKKNQLVTVRSESGTLKGIKIVNAKNKLQSIPTTTLADGSICFTMQANCVKLIPDFGTHALIGIGTPEEPYRISSYEELNLIAEMINNNESPMSGCTAYEYADYVLTRDIDCGNKLVSSIGDSFYYFGGVFDGCGYTISNVKVSKGLFSYVEDARIRNLSLNNVTVTKGSSAVLVYKTYGKTTISNIKISKAKFPNERHEAGIVYKNYGTRLEIVNCILDSVEFGNTDYDGYLMYKDESGWGENLYLRNILMIDCTGSEKISYKTNTSGSSTYRGDMIFYEDMTVEDGDKWRAEKIDINSRRSAEFVCRLSKYVEDELDKIRFDASLWGFNPSGYVTLSVLDEIPAVSQITYDAVFEDKNQPELLKTDTIPTSAKAGEIIEMKYLLRTSLLNLSIVHDGEPIAYQADSKDDGNGYGTLRFEMPAGSVEITNSNMPIQQMHIPGYGTEKKPYVISRVSDMKLLADVINGITIQYQPEESFVDYKDAYFVLGNDIDFGGYAWTQIGTANYNFNGTFDGKGFAIKNLNVNSGAGDGARHGLFVTLGENAVVKNLVIEKADVFSAEAPVRGAGAIAKVNLGTIEKCIVKDSSIQLGNWHYLGGIAGWNKGTIDKCAVINTSLTRRWGGSSTHTMGGITQVNDGMVSNSYTYNCTFANGTSENGAIIASGNIPYRCLYFTKSTTSLKYGNERTQESFNNGEVAYWLNASSTKKVTWYQNVSDGVLDLYPVLDSSHGIVYSGAKGYFNMVNTSLGIITGHNYSTSNMEKVMLELLPKVTNLQQTKHYAANQVTFNWKQIPDADGYAVYRATTKNGRYKYLKTVTTNTCTNAGLKAGSKYYYKVRAYKTVNGKKVYSEYSAIKSMITKVAAPANFCVTLKDRTAKISWSKVAGAQGYEIYVSGSRNGTYTKVKAVGPTTTSYDKTGLVKGKKYYFKMRAYTKNGTGTKIYSGYSKIKAVTIK